MPNSTNSGAVLPADSQEIMIDAQGIIKSFGDNRVLDGVSLTLRRGEVVAVIGPSGSCRSSLVRGLNLLEIIGGCSITIQGEPLALASEQWPSRFVSDTDVRRICRKMGMVSQSFNLFPHMTVLENIIEAPITVKRLPRQAAIAKADELLEKVGLLAKRDNYPGRLSGGQKQRVAIARALAMEPAIMLFDEPTSALDPELTVEVLRTMRQLAEEHMTMLVVTHEMGFAREVAHRVVFMDNGRIVESADSSVFFSAPQHERTRAFLGQML